MDKLIKEQPVIAILRDVPNDDLLDYMNSLYAGGLRAYEISFSNKSAPAQVQRARDHMPADAYIGAGTIVTADDARTAVESGADFMLSPSTNPAVLSYCAEHGLRFLPGVFSPTDVSVCLEYGFHTLKLFPASAGVHKGAAWALSSDRVCGGRRRFPCQYGRLFKVRLCGGRHWHLPG